MSCLKLERKEHGYTMVKKNIAIRRKDRAENEDRVRVAAVNRKVDIIDKFLGRYYPNYSYQKQIKEALKQIVQSTHCIRNGCEETSELTQLWSRALADGAYNFDRYIFQWVKEYKDTDFYLFSVKSV